MVQSGGTGSTAPTGRVGCGAKASLQCLHTISPVRVVPSGIKCSMNSVIAHSSQVKLRSVSCAQHLRPVAHQMRSSDALRAWRTLSDSRLRRQDLPVCRRCRSCAEPVVSPGQPRRGT